MFLGWIPQILALVDTHAVNVVGPLLLKIAETYPNAVTYPYNISRNNNLSNDVSKPRLIKMQVSIVFLRKICLPADQITPSISFLQIKVGFSVRE